MITSGNFRIRTPHAAIKIWNYVDRIEARGAAQGYANQVEEEIISTVSCSTIQTVKAKGSPMGTFNFILAPTRNWTAVITPGSWCAVMMSNEPISKEDFIRANPKLLKMIGKIESVRTDVNTNPDGSRITRYLVSGQDWGHVFNNTLYVDPLLLDGQEDANNLGNAIWQQLIKVINRDGTPQLSPVKENLELLLEIMGRPIRAEGTLSSRVAKNTHNILMPHSMKTFLFGDREDSSEQVMKNIKLISGSLDGQEGVYNEEVDVGAGFIDALSLVGSHNLWQVMQDNGNHVINEMFSDMSWTSRGLQFNLFNRIKPFAFRDKPLSWNYAHLRSMFQNLPTHLLDPVTIISVNAGTNWRDKFNFLEIKPELPDFRIYDTWVKQKAQAWDKQNNSDVFDREGFRPLILSTKHIPYKFTQVPVQTSTPLPNVPPKATDASTIQTPSPEATPEVSKDKREIGYYKNKAFYITLGTVQAPSGVAKVAAKAVADTEAWFMEANAQGIFFHVNSSFRTHDEQVRLKGTSPKFASEPGQSPHQSGRGLDIQPISSHTFEKVLSSTTEGAEVLQKLGALGEKYGWKRDVLTPERFEPWHFTYHNWYPSSEDLKDRPSNEVPVTTSTTTPSGPNVSNGLTGEADTATAGQTTLSGPRSLAEGSTPQVSPPPSAGIGGDITVPQPDLEALSQWTKLLQEWYFDNHRLLNGQLVMTGSTEYLPVGDNIMFDAELLGVKHNANKGHTGGNREDTYYILAHIESVRNIFQVDPDGARSFQTTIEFVRGILVKKDKTLVGDGALDILSTDLDQRDSLNNVTTVSIAASDDPGKEIL